jgi:hypothetical protein
MTDSAAHDRLRAAVLASSPEGFLPHEMFLVDHLAWLLGVVERLNRRLDADGLVLAGKAHPLLKTRETFLGLATSWMRHLRIDPRSRLGDPRDLQRARENERQARANLADLADDDLIPTGSR